MTEELPVDVPASFPVTEEELQMAKAELDRMTPESFVELTHYIKSIEESNLNAHGAFGAAKTKLYGIHGGIIELTSSRPNLKEAVEELFGVVGYIRTWQKHMNWSPSASQNLPAAPVTQTPAPVYEQPSLSINPLAPVSTDPDEPQYVDVGTTSQAPVTTNAPDPGLIKISVTAIQHQISTNGIHNLKVFGEPGFSKFGVTAWPEVIPIKGYESWDVSQKYGPQANMLFALVSRTPQKGDPKKNTNKVTAFLPA